MTAPNAGGALRLSCQAKVNLHLRVVRRRPDGYHELDTIFQALELADDLLARRSARPGVRMQLCSDGVVGGLPVAAGADNLVHRAATAFLDAAGLAGQVGLEFVLTKRIPAGGGLGGGSSDAAAALRLAQVLCGSPLGAERIAELALGLGADLPFFLVGGTCRGRGVGEVLSPLVAPPPLELVLILPGFGADTPSVFRALAESRQGGGAQTEVGLSYEVVRGDLQLSECSRNDLERPAKSAEPRLAALWTELEAVIEGGGLRMSGSGSTLFVARRDASAADAVAARLRERFAGDQHWPDLRVLRSCSASGLPEPQPADWPAGSTVDLPAADGGQP